MPAPVIPSLNIVTPSFNQGAYLKTTIDSVLSQNDPRLNYWVIDGGSQDNTLAVLRAYGKRIHWISHKDHGQTDAINQGINQSLGDLEDNAIIAYLNSDDYYLPGSFSKVRAFFATHPDCDWLVGDTMIVDTDGFQIQPLVRTYKRCLRHIPGSLWIGNAYPQPSVFWRARLTKRIGLFNEDLRFVMDYEYWLRATVVIGTPALLPDVLAAFRIHPGSKGSTQFRAQFSEGYKVVSRFTRNRLVLALHELHNRCILFVYDQVK